MTEKIDPYQLKNWMPLLTHPEEGPMICTHAGCEVRRSGRVWFSNQQEGFTLAYPDAPLVQGQVAALTHGLYRAIMDVRRGAERNRKIVPRIMNRKSLHNGDPATLLADGLSIFCEEDQC